MLDAAYALLGKVNITGDLKLITPSEGVISFSNTNKGNLVVDCERAECLWEIFDLLRELGIVDINASTIRALRNPLIQTLHVKIGENEVFEWRPNKFPKIKSARGLLDIFRSR